jgi:hypothetical protein
MPSIRCLEQHARAWTLAMLLLSSAACGEEADDIDMMLNPGITGALDAAAQGNSDSGSFTFFDGQAQLAQDGGLVPASDGSVQPASGGAVDSDGSVAAGDASVAPGDASVAGDGHFPRAGEAVNLAKKGPYSFATYTAGLNDPAYASAIMYYPKEAEPPFAAIVFSPGFTATKESYTVLGEIFASHGFAMMLTTPTSTGDYPPARGKDLEAAFARISLENQREGSPLKGKLATDRICITGHSMGGGGTLHGATALGSKIRCAVPLQPWEPGTKFAKIVAPTLFIAAQSDSIAGVAQNATVHYGSIPNTVEKIYAEFKGADHFLTTNNGRLWEEQSAVMVAFYKLKLEDDTRYAPYLYGGMEPKAALSKFEFSKQ